MSAPSSCGIGHRESRRWGARDPETNRWLGGGPRRTRDRPTTNATRPPRPWPSSPPGGLAPPEPAEVVTAERGGPRAAALYQRVAEPHVEPLPRAFEGLVAPGGPSRQDGCPDLDMRGEERRPAPVCGRPAAGVRKAHEAGPRLRLWVRARQAATGARRLARCGGDGRGHRAVLSGANRAGTREPAGLRLMPSAGGSAGGSCMPAAYRGVWPSLMTSPRRDASARPARPPRAIGGRTPASRAGARP